MTLGNDDSKGSTSRGRRQWGWNGYALDNVVMIRIGRSMKMLCELLSVRECRMLMTKQISTRGAGRKVGKFSGGEGVYISGSMSG